MGAEPRPAPRPTAAPDELGAVARFALCAVVFLGGAILMALEILGFRVIDKTFGSALRETSVVIAVFLGAMSLGYFLGGRWIDRWPRLRTPAFLLAAAGLATLAVPTLDATFGPRVFDSSLPIAFHSTVVATLLFALPAVLLSTLSPIAVRLLSESVGRSGRVAGGVGALSTVGSIVGSVAAAFALIDLFESVHRTIVALGLAAIGLAGLLEAARIAESETVGPRPRRAAAALATLAAVVAAAWALSAWSARALPSGEPARFRLGEVVFEQDSPFHRVTVVDRQRMRFLYFKYAETQSRMSLDDPYEGASEYTDYFHVPVLLGQPVERALFLGLGGGSAPKRYVRDYPGVVVDVVELDPLVVDVARRFFHFEPGPRLRVATVDARAFVKRSTETWDVVGIDAYTTNAYGSTLPAHLTTREFLAELAQRLSPEGWVVYNVAAPPHTPISRALSRTLYEVFPRQLVFEGATGNTVFVAGRSARLFKRDELVARAEAALADGSVRLRSLPAAAARMRTSVLPVGDAPVLTDDYAPVDLLMRRSRTWGYSPR